MTRRLAAFLLALAGAVPICGQGYEAAGDDLAHGRIRSVDAGVAVQRPDEPGAEEAGPNTPFLPGDRVSTDASGHAELQFPDGSAVRLDRRSKLEYLEHEAGRNDELVVLNLWSGSVYLRVRDDRLRADFVLETPDARVEVREPGSYRVDVLQDETRLRVYEGSARLESSRRSVQVESDETSLARRGEPPSRASAFDADDVDDDFARWDDERGQASWQADSLRYLPQEVQPYAADFDTYGQWHYEAEVGYVWRPRVAAGWRPYSDGRWTWTSYGWTWVPFESWGWAPSHYGRWGHSVSLGWYWIPGQKWSPAWVSWRAGGDYVGWCPLGRGDRPIDVPGGYRGYAAPRGPGTAPGGSGHWSYLRRADMGTRDIGRRRLELDALTAAQATPVDARWHLSRDLRPVERERAVPRSTRTRATPGDFVPELRYDPLTTIPPALPRRRPSDDRHDTRGAEGATGPRRAPAAEPAEQRQPQRREGSDPERRRTTGTSAAAGRPTSAEGEREAQTTERKRRAPSDDPDVLRHFFTPLVEPRSEGARTQRERGAQEDGQRDAPRAGSSSAAEERTPRRAAPRREPEREREPQAAPPPPSSSSSSSSGDAGAKERQPSRNRDRHH